MNELCVICSDPSTGAVQGVPCCADAGCARRIAAVLVCADKPPIRVPVRVPVRRPLQICSYCGGVATRMVGGLYVCGRETCQNYAAGG